MNNAIIIYFDEAGTPLGCKVTCDTDQQEKQLREIARHMMQAAIEGPHVCRCGGRCKGSEKTVKMQQRKKARFSFP